MGRSEEVRQLLRQGAEQALADLAAADARALRPLVGRLWDPDGEIRDRAARAIGRTAAVHPERGLEIVRRLMWALNDESATNGVHAVPALAEIGRHAPQTIAPFVPGMVSLTEDRGMRLALLQACCTIAETAPLLLAGELDRLEQLVADPTPEERRTLDRVVELTRGTDEGARG